MTGLRDSNVSSGSARPRDAVGPLFLERRSYRQRRLLDAARLLPVLGALLWLVPLLWPQADVQPGLQADLQAGEGAVTGVTTSAAIIYIFGIWAFLAAAALVLSLVIRDRTDSDDPAAQDTKAGTMPQTAGADGTTPFAPQRGG